MKAAGIYVDSRPGKHNTGAGQTTVNGIASDDSNHKTTG
jgi:hypothetical protein